MTPMSGKFIRSWTAGLISITRGQDCFTWLSGKDSTTPWMQQVGNHPNILRMHLMWSRHFTKLTQIIQPHNLIELGPCNIYLLKLSHSDDYLFGFFLEAIDIFY